MTREWRFYLSDMLDFEEKARRYTRGLTQTAFVENAMIYDATLRNLELIGEAATHVPAEVRGQCPEVPWRQVIATRNRLIHAYLGIDDDTLWSIIETDLPVLMSALTALLDRVDRLP